MTDRLAAVLVALAATAGAVLGAGAALGWF